MSKELTKEDMKEGVQELVKLIEISRAVIDTEFPGAGDLMIETLADELKAMLPEQTVCSAAGRGEAADESAAKAPCSCHCMLDFASAIRALKRGKRVARKGWNGKGQFVELATSISYKAPNGEVVNAEHDAIGKAALAFVGTSGVQMGWLASQADMLAEDWYVVE
jgi:hypothetical protein